MARQAPVRSDALRVLIVEDDATVAAAITASLSDAGMQARVAGSADMALEARSAFRPHVVLLDLELAEATQLLADLVDDADCGVVAISDNGSEAARVAGLEAGADDYVVKPVPLRELAARIRALRRRLARREAGLPPHPGQVLTVDPARRILCAPNQPSVPLTEAEAAALEALVTAAGSSVSRSRLSELALRRPLHAEDRSVDQLVLKLRRKLAALGASERSILSARRRGYTIPDPGQFQLRACSRGA